MGSFKSLVICLVAVLFMVTTVFAGSGTITREPSGEYSYETTISSLVNRRVCEEIKLVNTSSYALPFITWTVTINGKTHDMRPMPLLKLGDSEGFDGYFEDDMNREFLKYFGRDGRFSKKNNSMIKFTFKFKDHANDIAITDVYDGEEDLCFVVSDFIGEDSVVNEPAAPAVPEQAVAEPVPAQTVSQPAPAPQVQQVQSPASSGDTVIVIEGKTYILHDGKAYLLQ